MNKFETLLKAILKAVFKEQPYDKKKAKKSFEIIKEAKTQNKIEGETNGFK